MIDIALLLPTGLNPFSEKQNEIIREITVNSPLESIWVRDLPISSKIDKDTGSWYDPIAYLGFLTKFIEDSDCKLGIATINTSIRNPIITSKAIASLQVLSNNKLAVGLGSGDKQEVLNTFDVKDKEKLFVDFLSFLQESLVAQDHEFVEEVTLSLPKSFTPPPIHIASSSKNIWGKTSLPIDGWMTRFVPPDVFKQKYNLISKYQKIKEITLNINLILKEEENIFKITSYSGVDCIYIGEESLFEFLKIYSEIGVRRFLIYLPYSDDYVKDLQKIVKVKSMVIESQVRSFQQMSNTWESH